MGARGTLITSEGKQPLDIRIRELYEHIGSLRCESMQDRIESRVFKAPTGEPVQGGTTGDPTAMIAFCSNQQEIQAARRKISEYRIEKDALQRELDEIDAALAVLNEPELFIVDEYYISGYSWRQVEPGRYIDALLRHTLAMANSPRSRDDESGIEHYKHVAANAAFLCELLK